MACADTLMVSIEKMANDCAMGHWIDICSDLEQIVDPSNLAKLCDNSMVHAKIEREMLKHIPPPMMNGFRVPKR